MYGFPNLNHYGPLFFPSSSANWPIHSSSYICLPSLTTDQKNLKNWSKGVQRGGKKKNEKEFHSFPPPKTSQLSPNIPKDHSTCPYIVLFSTEDILFKAWKVGEKKVLNDTNDTDFINFKGTNWRVLLSSAITWVFIAHYFSSKVTYQQT